MTATAAVATATNAVGYGMRELRGLYQRYAFWGLGIAFGLHLGAIGGYYLAQYLSQEEDPVITVRIMKYSELGPPPSITNSDAAPQVQVSTPVAKPTIGVPVPVPDAEVSPEQTIATQQELSNISAPTTEGNGTGTGTQIEQDIKVNDEDPPDFVPVEKMPTIVKAASVEYPDLAKRAGLEGTVVVKMLVNKEGKVTKAQVVKSDADVFNDPALAAAKQYEFTPAIMNNGPVAVWVMQPFRFKLNK
ncbi:MAG TPA: TonB family protein [Bacteroidota bacterium]|nr:TonB family protein [Bacteroidota bacterium]